MLHRSLRIVARYISGVMLCWQALGAKHLAAFELILAPSCHRQRLFLDARRYGDAVAAFFLGNVKSGITRRIQGSLRIRMFGAAATPMLAVMRPIPSMGCCVAPHTTVGQPVRPSSIYVRAKQGKFFTTQSRGGVVTTASARQCFSYLSNDQVTSGMTVRVVDSLHVINIEQQQCAGRTVTMPPFNSRDKAARKRRRFASPTGPDRFTAKLIHFCRTATKCHSPQD